MITIIIVCACLLLNAVLSCAEMAFVTIDDKLLRKKVLEGNKSAAYIAEMGESPERILSVVQIGITLVGAISGAVSGAGAEENLAPLLQYIFGFTEQLAGTLSIIAIVAPLTILSVVIGELVPKSLAIRYSMPIILAVAPGLKVAEKILGPLVNPMEKATDFILRIIMKSKGTPEEDIEAEELSLKGLRQEYKQYFHNLLDLDSKHIDSIMVPWEKVDHLSSIAEPDEVSSLILRSRRTRIPVMDANEVYGYLHSKEFVNLSQSGVGSNWLSFVRPIQAMAKETKVLHALRSMQKKKAHFMVVGSLEQPLGIITLEDILEEVFGDFVDEDEDGKVKLYLRRSKIFK
ncbi:MAG: hemolysin family protein [Bdellovibrionales bacterium]|nr:hemolysin family protein [Bdellovibrionales bacterium]